MKYWLASGLLASVFLLSGCANDGGGSGGGGGGLHPGQAGPPGGFPNDGTVPTQVTEGGVPIAGNFICTDSATAREGATTEVGANGLVGQQLTDLLNMVGATDATTLLNSVVDKDLTIDGNIDTGSTFNLAAAGLAGNLDSVDQNVLLHKTVPKGTYAVFGISFPAGTAELTLVNSITVRTFIDDVSTAQESQSFSEPIVIDLLGQNGVGEDRLFLGIKATLPFDTAQISLEPTALSADVGAAMKVHELCTNGRFVNTNTGTPAGSPLAGAPLDPTQLCAIPTLGPQIVAGAGGTCPSGGGAATPLDPAGLCAVPGIGPPLAGVAGATCPAGGGGGTPPLSPSQLCAIPTIGPQLVAGVGGSCGTGGGGTTPAPDATQLCAIPTLGPALVAGAGLGTCP